MSQLGINRYERAAVRMTAVRMIAGRRGAVQRAAVPRTVVQIAVVVRNVVGKHRQIHRFRSTGRGNGTGQFRGCPIRKQVLRQCPAAYRTPSGQSFSNWKSNACIPLRLLNGCG